MKKHISFVFLPVIACSLTSCQKVPNIVDFKKVEVNVTTRHTDPQVEFLNSIDPEEYCTDNFYYMNNPNAGDKNITAKPKAASFTVEVSTDNGANASSYVIHLGEKEDGFDLTYSSGSNTVDIYNLKIHTKYYYYAEVMYGSTGFKSEVKSFTTEDTVLRNMYIDGVENFRDLGGYLLENGKHFKQGMIYRSAQFNYDHSDSNPIKSEVNGNSRNELLNNLKIKTDADFREKNNAKGVDETVGLKDKSPLGDNVNYQYLPMRYGGNNVLTSAQNKESILSFLNLLANKDNYPVVFHCIQGKDRTGALAYAIQALLGVSLDDMKRDYLFTNFANVGTSVTKWMDGLSQYPAQINAMEGDSISMKARNYLKQHIGVSDDTLDNIINILIED